jgi:hypothetical protein
MVEDTHESLDVFQFYAYFTGFVSTMTISISGFLCAVKCLPDSENLPSFTARTLKEVVVCFIGTATCCIVVVVVESAAM